MFNIACLTFIIAWCGCEDEPPYSHHCVSVAVRMSCLTVIIACLSFIIAWCGCEDELPYSHHCVPFVHHCVVWL